MNIRLLAFAAVLTLSTTAFAGQPEGFWVKPAIPAYGPVHVWPEAVARPDARQTYKAVFDLTKGDPTSDKVNPGLAHIARAVNVFASVGVPVSHLRFDVIVHGSATPLVLGDKAFMAKYGHANPNLAVIADLKKAGIKVLVCGNALGDMDLTPAEVNPDIEVALSALSTLIIRQNQGYALISM